MWQLMFNGLNLAGSLASLGSFASGFSLEKDVDQIQASLRRLEHLLDELLDASGVSRGILEEVAPIVSGFRNLTDPSQQALSVGGLEQLRRSIHREVTETTRSILATVLAEMRAVVGSIHFAQSPPRETPRNILRRLITDPYDAGVTEIWDISDGGLYARDEPRLVNPTRLRQFGLDVHPPKYTHNIDGLVFSERHGLYLPSYLVATR
jgi:hypothetical protein